MPSGYSRTPLAKKLGIADGASVAVIGAPKNYARLVAPLPIGATIVKKGPKDAAFVQRRAREFALRR